MRITTTLLLVLAIVLCNSISYAQNDAQNDLTLNRSVLRYYNGLEIQEFENSAPDQHQALVYYFTSSFLVRHKKCIDCDVNYNDFFNQDLFNIVEFEGMRAQNDTVTFIFKEVYHITLKPSNEVAANLNGVGIDEMITLVAPRPLPSWNPTGNDTEDYAAYKRYLQVWIRDFPEKYRTLTSGSTLSKITVAEFLSMPIDRREAFTSNSGMYLIVD